MGLRRHRQIVVWSSSPGRPGALGFTRAPRAARIRWCFRASGLLAVGFVPWKLHVLKNIELPTLIIIVCSLSRPPTFKESI